MTTRLTTLTRTQGSNVVPMEPGCDLGELVRTGQVDAAIGVDVDHPDVVPLIPEATRRGSPRCASAATTRSTT